MHSLYDVRVVVRDYQSEMPVDNANISVSYDYDSYGWFLFANTPDPVETRTDKNGEAVLKIADYRYRIIMRVEDKPASLNKQLVKNGGDLNVPANSPVYKVKLSPL